MMKGDYAFLWSPLKPPNAATTVCALLKRTGGSWTVVKEVSADDIASVQAADPQAPAEIFKKRGG
jgi:hypothetical protein